MRPNNLRMPGSLRPNTATSEASEAPVDVHAELKRLRRENAVLKQERDILKKAAAFFAKEGSR